MLYYILYIVITSLLMSFLKSDWSNVIVILPVNETGRIS